jgi:hypothetical protein
MNELEVLKANEKGGMAVIHRRDPLAVKFFLDSKLSEALVLSAFLE